MVNEVQGRRGWVLARAREKRDRWGTQERERVDYMVQLLGVGVIRVHDP